MDENDFPTDSGEYFLYESFAQHQQQQQQQHQQQLQQQQQQPFQQSNRPPAIPPKMVQSMPYPVQPYNTVAMPSEDEEVQLATGAGGGDGRSVSLINNYNPSDMTQRVGTIPSMLDDYHSELQQQQQQQQRSVSQAVSHHPHPHHHQLLPHQSTFDEQFDDNSTEIDDELIMCQEPLSQQPFLMQSSSRPPLPGDEPSSYYGESPSGRRKGHCVTSPAESGVTTAALISSSISNTPSSMMSSTLFRLDHRNCCVFTVLIVLLIAAVFTLAFVLGSYLAFIGRAPPFLPQSNFTSSPGSPKRPATVALDDGFGSISLGDFPSSSDGSTHYVNIATVYPPQEAQPGQMRLDAYYAKISDDSVGQAGLPTTIVPEHYDLYLDLTRFLSHLSIWARVSITVRPTVTTHSVVLHAAQTLNVKTVNVYRYFETNDEKVSTAVGNWTQNEQLNVLNINTREPLLSDNSYKIDITYTILVTCSPHGGFMCIRQSAAIEGNNSSSLNHVVSGFTTKFEPTMASAALPCWDEPQYKAIFNVTMRYPNNMVALTNTAAFDSVRDDQLDHVTTYHYETPPMSTYLLSFAYGDFAKLQSTTQRAIPFTIYCLPKNINMFQYALDFAVETLDKLEKYFKIKYPLSKMDFVATPSYAAAAMENWGLVVFTDNILMVYPKHNNDKREHRHHRYDTQKIIAHELLHQWFGNLITLDWWSEIWLNEGITTHFIPKLHSADMADVYRRDQLDGIADLFSLEATDRRFSLYQTETDSVRDLYKMFTSSVYMKGGLVTSVLENLRGESQFQTDMRLYIRQNQYSSVNQSALWRAIQYVQFANKTIATEDFMHGWLHNKGLPLITITTVADGERLEISQTTTDINRFREYVPHELNAGDSQLWHVPLNIKTQGGHLYQLLMDRRQIQIPRLPLGSEPDPSNASWVLANPGLQYPFRVNYDQPLWLLLIEQLKIDPSVIPLESRVQILLDAEAFLVEKRQVTNFLSLLEYLTAEQAPEPLLLAADAMSRLLYAYRHTQVYQLLLVYMKPIIIHTHAVLTARDDRDTLWRQQTAKFERARSLYCLVSGACEPISGQRMQHLLDSITVGSVGSTRHMQREDLNMLKEACHCLAKHPAKYRQQIRQLMADLVTYGVQQSDDGYSGWSHPDAARTSLALCAVGSGQQSELLEQLQQVPDLYRAWPVLLVKEPHLLDSHTVRLLLWQSLVSARDSLSLSHVRRHRALLHSVASLNELRLAAQLFDGALLPELHFERARLSWLHAEAAPTIQRWLLAKLSL